MDLIGTDIDVYIYQILAFLNIIQIIIQGKQLKCVLKTYCVFTDLCLNWKFIMKVYSTKALDKFIILNFLIPSFLLIKRVRKRNAFSKQISDTYLIQRYNKNFVLTIYQIKQNGCISQSSSNYWRCEFISNQSFIHCKNEIGMI